MIGCRPEYVSRFAIKGSDGMRANPCVTEASGGSEAIASVSENGNPAFGRANIGLAQRLLVCPRRSGQPESLCAGGSGSDGQPAFAGDGRLFCNRDETWLPEWSGKLGGVERCAVRSRGVSWGKPVFRLTGQVRWLKVWRGGGCKFSATERAHKRNGDRIDAECRRPGLVTIIVRVR